ncbi:hypothetical protein CEXT_451291 [Caerostris extrusa]|uniref:Uncharacterized protein n=1 Tax=Caerostris extrusa TaxID=172846 RepID=A0AAV4QJ42_CAEEX|nr:hypothetical protein CEXT_451291 [Caerostris extrusa]
MVEEKMERDATMDYFVRESAPGASNPELMDTTCAAIKLGAKKDIAQNLYDAYAAALIGYSTDDDDFEEIKILHDDLTACNEGSFRLATMTRKRHDWPCRGTNTTPCITG